MHLGVAGARPLLPACAQRLIYQGTCGGDAIGGGDFQQGQVQRKALAQLLVVWLRQKSNQQQPRAQWQEQIAPRLQNSK